MEYIRTYGTYGNNKHEIYYSAAISAVLSNNIKYVRTYVRNYM